MSENNAMIRSINQYLKEVLHCESQLYTLNEIVERTGNKMRVLEQQLPELAPPSAPPVQPLSTSVSKGAKMLGRLAGAFFIGLFLAGFLHSFNSPVILVFVAFVSPFIVVLHGMSNKKDSSKQIKQAYQEDMQKHSKMQAERLQLQQNNAEKLRKYQSQLPLLINLINEVENTLNHLYSENIIHPKYRNLTAVSSFVDYLSTGRTASLVRSGSDPGAYNLFEEDVRANRILDAINRGFSTLSMQLSQISQNQYSLYSAVREGQKVLEGVSNLIEQSNQHFDKSSYYLQEVANNTRILKDVQRDRWGALRDLGGYRVHE